LRRRAAALQHPRRQPWEASRPIGELAAEIVEIANQSFHDRADLMEVAKEVITKTDSRTAAELSWAS
jgi:hypothetical protein